MVLLVSEKVELFPIKYFTILCYLCSHSFMNKNIYDGAKNPKSHNFKYM